MDTIFNKGLIKIVIGYTIDRFVESFKSINQIETLEWYIDLLDIKNVDQLFIISFEMNKIDIAKYLKANFTISKKEYKYCFDNAIKYGNLIRVKWLYENGCINKSELDNHLYLWVDYYDQNYDLIPWLYQHMAGAIYSVSTTLFKWEITEQSIYRKTIYVYSFLTGYDGRFTEIHI